MRIIFFGTSDFAVPILGSLLKHCPDDIVAVVTKPDQPESREDIPTPPPVKQFLETLRSIDADDGVFTHNMNATEYRVIAASSLAAYSVVAGHFDDG